MISKTDVLAVLAMCLFLSVAPLARAEGAKEKPPRPFRAADYRAKHYRVSDARHRHGGLEVRIVQVKDLEHDPRCRGWLEIRPEGRGASRWIDRGVLEPVGSSYGLFVPRSQPSASLFLAVELHDYDGHLLVIDRKGGLREFPGGAFFVDLKRRLLFSESFSDVKPFLAILDLDTGKPIFQGVDREMVRWYRAGSGLFFTTTTGKGEDRTKGLFFNFDKKIFESRSLTPASWAEAVPVDRDFDPRWYLDCYSEARDGD